MTDLRMILDPGGSSGRPGFNIVTFPSGQVPLQVSTKTTLDRVINSALVATGFPTLYEYQWISAATDLETQNKLAGLDWHIKNGQMRRTSWEIVIYNLSEPFTEVGTARKRYRVPGTTNIAEISLGSGLFQFTYWIALQGYLTMVKESFHTYRFGFQEGTYLTSAME